jgi:hypothetical protein
MREEFMPDPTADPVAPPQNATGLASLLDALARFQSAALLYPPTHRRITESTGALVDALRRAADVRGEVRLALSDGRLLRDGALVPDLAGPARKLVADWDALGVARIAFLPQLVPDDLVAFARFLKEALTHCSSGHRPTLASFELVPASIDIVSRDYGRPHRADEAGTADAVVPQAGGGGEGTGGGTGDGIGPGRQRTPRRPVDEEEIALNEATAQRDAAVAELAPESLAKQLRVAEEAPPERARLAADDRVATLARVLHLLGRATPPSAGRAALEVRLADLVSQGYGDAEQAVVESGLTAMVRAARARELATLLDALGPALRAHGAARAAELLLDLLDAQADAEPAVPPRPPQEVTATRRALWVHLAQELLLSLGAQSDAVERRASRLLGQLDPEECDAAVAELAALPAIRSGTWNKSTLAPMRRDLYGLYRALLRVGGPIADDLAKSFAQRPPATSAAGAFLALRDDVRGARAWLERFLAAARAGKEDAELLSHAGTILRTCLETLEAKRRAEPWVASAVAALRRLSSSGTDATLARIRGERRLLVLPGWPRACRDAAGGGGGR